MTERNRTGHPESLGEAIARSGLLTEDYWAKRRRAVERRGSIGSREIQLARIDAELAYLSGHLTREDLERVRLQCSARLLLTAPVPDRPFPGDTPALVYALMRQRVERRQDVTSLEAHRAYENGKSSFRRWYDPIESYLRDVFEKAGQLLEPHEFRAAVSGIVFDDPGCALDLLGKGQRVADRLCEDLESGVLPWLPSFVRDDENVAAWWNRSRVELDRL